jgi:CDP-diglyceride synthetase
MVRYFKWRTIVSKPRTVTKADVNPAGGYSLASLFLLLALFAAMLAHVSPLLNSSFHEVQPLNPVVLVVVCGMTGSVLGIIVGLHHYRQPRGTLLGVLLGVVFGSLSGPVVAASMAFPQPTILISSATAAVLLGIAAFFRQINDEDPVSQKAVYEAKLREWQLNSSKTGAENVEKLGSERSGTT